jgi:hypothetical protein
MGIKKFLKVFLLGPLIPIISIVDEGGENNDSNPDSPEELPDVNDGAQAKLDGDSDGDDPPAEPEDSRVSESGEGEDEETVPLSTFLEVKNKLRSEKRKNAEFEDARLSKIILNKKEEIRQMFIDRGYASDAAEDMAALGVTFMEEIYKDKQTNADKIIEEEISDLSKDDFYSDIGKYKNEIKETIRKAKTADLNLTAEQAYMMLAGDKTKMKEYKVKQEVIESVKGTNRKPTKNIPGAQAKGKSNPYKLDEDDKAALKLLKEMQPDFGWDEKKYWESRNK